MVGLVLFADYETCPAGLSELFVVLVVERTAYTNQSFNG